jgi:uncharacterized phage infection (PIP) family protein YhgE
MATRTKNPAPSVQTLNAMLEESEEYMRELISLSHKMHQLKSGSEKYFDLMADAATAATVVREKMNSLISEVDAITEAMPDDA